MKSIKHGDWVRVYACANCEEQLTNNQKMSSDGVCPSCGASSGSTIVRTLNNIVIRKVFEVIKVNIFIFHYKEKNFIGYEYRNEESLAWLVNQKKQLYEVKK